MCITPTKASDFFQLSSLTTNGNSLLAQSGVANSNPRNLIMNLYNSIYVIKNPDVYGDWGLGIGDWAQSPIPNPQSPIPKGF